MSLQFMLQAAADADLDVSFGRCGSYRVEDGRYYVRIERLHNASAKYRPRSICCVYGNDIPRALETAIREALVKVGARDG